MDRQSGKTLPSLSFYQDALRKDHKIRHQKLLIVLFQILLKLANWATL
jgi:hypothetical protein